MSVHAYVDESSRASCHLVAAIVEPTQLAAIRARLRALRLPGERRLHFQSEGNAQRSVILGGLRGIDARARVEVGRGSPSRVRGRNCGADSSLRGAWRLAIDSRGEKLDRVDRRFIGRSLTAGSPLTYEHLVQHEAPLLWIADAVAWCYGAPLRWRSRVEPLTSRSCRSNMYVAANTGTRETQAPVVGGRPGLTSRSERI